MVTHQTEQERHSYLFENFNQIFNDQLVGHEVKLKEDIVNFVGEKGDTFYLIKLKETKFRVIRSKRSKVYRYL